jgi:hypothetical protein
MVDKGRDVDPRSGNPQVRHRRTQPQPNGGPGRAVLRVARTTGQLRTQRLAAEKVGRMDGHQPERHFGR